MMPFCSVVLIHLMRARTMVDTHKALKEDEADGEVEESRHRTAH